jgi:hypothetical protein
MRRIKLLALFLLTCCLSACGDYQIPRLTDTMILEIRYTENVPTATVETTTRTPMVEERTDISTTHPFTSTPTITSTAKIIPPIPECFQNLPKLPESASSTGKFLFWSKKQTFDLPLIVMDMDTWEKKELLDVRYKIGLSAAISPTMEWLAFHDLNNNKLMLMDANLKLSEVSDWDEQWRWITGWLNNEQIQFRLMQKNETNEIFPLGLLNIYTKEYEEIERDYPRFIFTTENEGWIQATIYDPTLSKVAYPAFPNSEGNKSIVMLDIKTNDIITEIKDFHFITISRPKWTSDGKYLILVKEDYLGKSRPEEDHEEFFRVSYEGDVKRLTYFNDYHKFSRIGSFSLSPDEQFLAFWFQDKSEGDNEYLNILNLQTLEIIDTCIYHLASYSNAIIPYWSPDNHAMVIMRDKYRVEGDQDDVTSEIIYIDLINGFAASIAEDVVPIGWLVNSPVD